MRAFWFCVHIYVLRREESAMERERGEGEKVRER